MRDLGLAGVIRGKGAICHVGVVIRQVLMAGRSHRGLASGTSPLDGHPRGQGPGPTRHACETTHPIGRGLFMKCIWRAGTALPKPKLRHHPATTWAGRNFWRRPSALPTAKVPNCKTDRLHCRGLSPFWRSLHARFAINSENAVKLGATRRDLMRAVELPDYFIGRQRPDR
jgi:hypothetical protein